MLLAERFRAHRMLTLGVAGTMTASLSLVAAIPAQAVETYPRPLNSTITISGHAYGHGHGLSQWGAYGAAAVGKLSWQSILGFYYPGTKLVNLGNTNIRVRLDAVGSGTLYVYNVAGLRLAGIALPGPTTGVTQYRVRATTTGLAVEKLTSTVWSLYKTAVSPAVISSSTGLVDVKLASGARRTYRGSIYANRASSASLTPVSVLPMESYLRAVVPAEMPASWHANAVRAQAVAARSYAGYDRAHATAGRTWDTCDTTSCQMYSGVPAENAASDQAVTATAGQTLTYGGTPAFTQFSAANGGWTAAGGQPYLVAKADPYDGAIANSANSWSTSITASQIQVKWPSIGTYRQLRILTRDGHGQWGGRVLTAAIDGSKGSVAVSGATIRSAFGLKSDWFIPTNPAVAPANPRDFNSDRKADVLAVVAGTGALRLYPGNGASGWKPMSVVGNGFQSYTKVFTAGKWNSDASSDVMVRLADGTLWLYPGTASGTFSSPWRIGSGWNMYNLVIPAGDFNGDGHSDLLARAADGSLMLYSANGSGGFLTTIRRVGGGWGGFTSVFSPGDFNGDGKSDVIARTSGGLLYLYPGNGSGGWLQPRLIGRGWNAFSTIIGAGDFNGDGRSDVFGRGLDGTLWMYPGNGTGGFLGAKAVGRGWNIFSTILP
jgi:stage II sporulation protein D